MEHWAGNVVAVLLLLAWCKPSEETNKIRCVTEERHHVLLDILAGRRISERFDNATGQAAYRQLRRWRALYNVQIREHRLAGRTEPRIFIENTILLKEGEVKSIIKKNYTYSKGGSISKVSKRIGECLHTIDHSSPSHTNDHSSPSHTNDHSSSCHDNEPQSTSNDPPCFTIHISTPSELHDSADQCLDQGTDSRFLLCHFPNEILRHILRHIVTTSAAHVGILRLLFPESVRFNALLAELFLPRIYVSPSVVAYMEGSLNDIPVGQLREWSLTKLYRYVGKNSGLATEIRDLFGYFKKWLFGKVVVCAVGLGWFKLHDFHPSGGWGK